MHPSSDIPTASIRAAAAFAHDPAAPFDRPITDLMQQDLLVIQMDDTLAEAQRALAARGLSWAPVVDGGQAVLGVLGESDLLLFEAAGREPQTTCAWQVCTYRPVSVAPETPAREVARMMVERHIHHVVVLRDGALAGVVSSMDFLRVIAAAA